MKALKAEGGLFLMTLIWGGTFLFTKIGLEYCSTPMYLIFRFSTALILSLIFFRKYIFSIGKQTARQGFILGLFFGGGFLLQTYGLEFTTVTKSAFITGMAVPLTPFISWLIQKKKISIWSITGVVIAFVGLLIFAQPDFYNVNIGDALTLISTFFWAFYITYMDVFTKGSTSKAKSGQLVFMQFVGAIPLVLLTSIAINLIDSNSFKLVYSDELVLSLAYNGILASFFVTLIHTSIQRYTTPVKAALIFSMEPIIASALAVIFVGAVLQGHEYYGGAILLLGVLTSEVGGFFKNRAAR
ncbi:MAG: DMT family transporter [Candidatus Kapabacteria bacterium]|nr:DMT family transporter [Candidatus Kapabacteria bacterium]